MKRISLIIALAAGALLCACDKDTEGVSKITIYPEIILNGSELVTLHVGGSYTDAGVKAFEGEEDISDKVVATGSVNTSAQGYYPITYVAANAQGFEASAQRDVYVVTAGGLAEDISGTYTCNIDRTYGGATVARGPFDVVIGKIGTVDGIFTISDLLGGWYEFGSGYGAAYAAPGVFFVNGSNELFRMSSSLPGFGDTISLFDASTYDPATKTLVIKAIMDSTPGMQFVCTLVKQ